MDRRRFMQLSLVGGAPSLLSGCWIFGKKPDPCKVFASQKPSPDSPFIIDVHAHFFNGTDLQVSKFVSQVAGREIVDWVWLRKVAGTFLQFVAWNLAPTAKQELNLLKSFCSCKTDEVESFTLLLRDQQFKVAISESVKSLTAMMSVTASAELRLGIQNLITSLPETYEQCFSEEFVIQLSANDESILRQELGIEVSSFRQVIRFVVEFFQLRYVSASNYLKAYNTHDRKIDITISNLVDYDWFLNKGKPTLSPLNEQMQVMAEIAKRSEGIVNYYIPYCPLRHLAFKKGKEPVNPLELVKQAVNEYGAMGVKLYPPMGFSLWENAKLQRRYPNLWRDKKYLPDIAKSESFGAELDECLAEFYSECEKHDIPIMAHTSVSNLSHDDFRVIFSQSSLTELFLQRYPKLKTNFGHFGSFGWAEFKSDEQPGESENISNAIWWYLSSIMKAQQEAGEDSLFADTGFFSSALEKKDEFKKVFVKLLETNPHLASNMVFGTDWKMLVSQKGVNRYIKVFEEILDDEAVRSLAGSNIKAAVMGENALRYLGLQSGSPALKRQLKFHSPAKPHWAEKLAN